MVQRIAASTVLSVPVPKYQRIGIMTFLQKLLFLWQSVYLLAAVTEFGPMLVTATAGTGHQLNCDFLVDTCKWSQSNTNIIDWKVRKGSSTATGSNGPSSDHTTGLGGYAILETSNFMRQGLTAALVSTILKEKTGCLSFWYNMNGNSVGALKVYKRLLSGKTTELWQKNGTQGDQWHFTQVTSGDTNTYQFIIEAVSGKGSKGGDIAIDDVIYSEAACGNFACNFDQSDLCGFTQDRDDQFDWLSRSLGTSSIRTGPESDHTYGTSQGKYMYIESSAPRKKGDKARLTSPILPANIATDFCVTFWYHMHGQDIGTLNLYIRQHDTANLKWTKTGSQGNNWLKASVRIKDSADSGNNLRNQMVFEGVIGNGFLGDIAIDDVTVTSGDLCEGIVKENLVIDCSFESTCLGWTNTQTGDVFDWITANQGTSSAGTGPNNDHTLGDKTGRYLYIETSSPRQEGDNAFYISTVLPATQGSCLKFYYHMYGVHIGELNVYKRTQNGMMNELLWKQSDGKQLNKWMPGSAQVMSSTPFYLVFEGVRGAGHSGDIALDDITYTSVLCPVIPLSAAQSPGLTSVSRGMTSTTQASAVHSSLTTCDFDSNLCGWSQSKADQFDWTRTSGTTGSGGTGPSNDHTGRTSHGYYMYIETSSPRKHSDKAWLISPTIESEGAYCFTFWYHMYGSSTNTLNIRLISSSGVIGSPIWIKKNNQGNKWHQGQVTIMNTDQKFNVVIEGIVGISYLGDIAIDDVDMDGGTCPSHDHCSFEDSRLCGWSQSKDNQFDWIRHSGSTPSRNTGPSVDHTTGNTTGFYMYIETSMIRQGWKADLLSPTYHSGSPKCLNLWYHMWGEHIDTLSIIMKQMNTNSEQIIWSTSGDKGDQWLLIQVTVPVQTSDWQVILRATAGFSSQGDIAIDDFSLDDGVCVSSTTANSITSLANTVLSMTTSLEQLPSTAASSTADSSAHPVLAQTSADGSSVHDSVTTPAVIVDRSIHSASPSRETIQRCDFEAGLCGWTQL